MKIFEENALMTDAELLDANKRTFDNCSTSTRKGISSASDSAYALLAAAAFFAP